MFSGFGSYLAELYPTAVRGAGQGFCYNFGRAAGALFRVMIGLLALLALPETRGKELAAD